MSNSPAIRRSRILLCVAILAAASMIYYHVGLFIPRAVEVRTAQGLGNGYSFGADFYPIWVTAREGLLHHRDPYSSEMTRQIQIGLFGFPPRVRQTSAPSNYRAFAYPAFAEALFWPLAVLPFPVVRLVLAITLPVVTALSVILWLRALHLRAGPVAIAALVVLTLSSYTVLEGWFAEQPGLLAGFLLAAGFAALARERFFLSGGLLALTLIKPQMMLLAAIYLLLWSFARFSTRWRFAAGFFLISTLLVASSLFIWPRWIPEWLQVMQGYPQYSTPPLVYYLLGLQPDSRLGPILIAVLLVSAVVRSWHMRLSAPTSKEFALTISLLFAITTITLLPGHAVYDHVILLPGLILIASSWRELAANRASRVISALAVLAVSWQWLWAPLVIVVRPFLSRQFFVSHILMLPIRTAASIPFCVAALLGIMAWQGSRKTIHAGENG